MGLRLFSEQTGWEQARKETRFSAARLDAVNKHGALSKPLRALLGQWNTTDQERRDADDAVVDANAVVSAVNDLLDEAVSDLAARLVYEGKDKEGKENANDAGLKAFFPEPPNEVIRLGLESEIERTKKFATVAAERKVSKEVAAILKTITDVHTRGKDALTARENAFVTVSRVSLRIQTWKENANGARRGVHNALEAYAIEKGLERSYADAFFPAAARAKKRVEKKLG